MESQSPGKPRGGRLLKALIVLVVVLAVAGGGVAILWVAPTPDMFEQNLTLVAAEEQAAGEGKIVLAVSTADWCLLCQRYKRGALTSDAVETWVAANAEPVYINVSADEAANERLGVDPKPGALPVTTLLRDGEVLAQHVGVMNEEELLQWLGENTNNPPVPAPTEGDASS